MPIKKNRRTVFGFEIPGRFSFPDDMEHSDEDSEDSDDSERYDEPIAAGEYDEDDSDDDDTLHRWDIEDLMTDDDSQG